MDPTPGVQLLRHEECTGCCGGLLEAEKEGPLDTPMAVEARRRKVRLLQQAALKAQDGLYKRGALRSSRFGHRVL